MESLILLLLAVLALSFLIFIHELGHYVMAKREGMRVETFSIGFGRPIYSWEINGVHWQIGWLPFGGFVKIAGTDSEKDSDLYKVKDGFFGKSPWSRIKVALSGPLVNILFALLAFALLWVSGGREKTFSEYTHKIGVIDPQSELYQWGIRPGDEIAELGGKPYQGMQDLIYASLTSSGPLEIKGYKINYDKGDKVPFSYEITPYTYSSSLDKTLLTTGILAPANYLIYDPFQKGKEILLPENSPMKDSGIEPGDRLLWIDGHRIFSLKQLSTLLNEGRALLTIRRKGETLLLRVPRVLVQELKFDPAFRDELTDWQFAAGLQGTKFSKLYTIPYNLTNDGVVENEVRFIDKENEEAAFPITPDSPLEAPLQPEDRIIAIDGTPVKHSSEIIKLLQDRSVHLIVQRARERPVQISWREVDQVFDKMAMQEEIDKIGNTIGLNSSSLSSKDLVLLKPIKLKAHEEIYANESSALLQSYQEEKNRQIAAVEDPEKRAELIRLLEQRDKKLELGLPIRDLRVEYNPVPTDQFTQVFGDIWRTLSALFTGSLNPKWMSGPIGIVHLFQEQSRSGMGDALYWLGVISLNLGVLNLLPIPMLDGGTIALSLFEAVTGKKIKPKTMEKLILPFAILLIAFLAFLTYHDLGRIFGGFFRS